MIGESQGVLRTTETLRTTDFTGKSSGNEARDTKETQNRIREIRKIRGAFSFRVAGSVVKKQMISKKRWFAAGFGTTCPDSGLQFPFPFLIFLQI